MSIAKVALLSLILFVVSHADAWSSSGRPAKDSIDCSFVGQFIEISPVKIKGHDLRPVSISVGTFRKSKIIKDAHMMCSQVRDEFEVVFSNGISDLVAFSNGCAEPRLNEKYQITVTVKLDGTFFPASCSSWIKEVK